MPLEFTGEVQTNAGVQVHMLRCTLCGWNGRDEDSPENLLGYFVYANDTQTRDYLRSWNSCRCETGRDYRECRCNGCRGR